MSASAGVSVHNASPLTEIRANHGAIVGVVWEPPVTIQPSGATATARGITPGNSSSKGTTGQAVSQPSPVVGGSHGSPSPQLEVVLRVVSPHRVGQSPVVPGVAGASVVGSVPGPSVASFVVFGPQADATRDRQKHMPGLEDRIARR